MGAEITGIENINQNQKGYLASRLNATRHGILSRHAVLPWEDKGDYDVLLDSLGAEYQPSTPTESHLVEELAGIMWRKARVRLAEGSMFRKEVSRQIDSYSSTPDYVKAALVTTDTEAQELKGGLNNLSESVTEKEAREAAKSLAYWEERQSHFKTKGRMATLPMLDDEDKADWADYRKQMIEDRNQQGYSQPSDDTLFADWLKECVSHFKDVVTKHRHAPAIRQQLIGLSYATDRMDGVARYETHLDRKFERVLAMLLKLKDLSQAKGVVAQ